MFKDIKEKLQGRYSVLKNRDIEEQLLDEISSWDKSVHRKLQVDNPFFENQKKYNIATTISEEKIKISDIKSNLIAFNELSDISKCKIDNKFWISEINKIEQNILQLKNKGDKNQKKLFKKINNDLVITNRLLLEKWGEALEKEYQKWEFEEIQKYRNQLLKKLEDWLKLLQQIQDVMDDLSLDTGLLFDLSKGNITLQDINQLEKWAEYISQNEGVKRLCDMLGRLRTADKSIKQEIIKTTELIQETVKDYTSKEEIVGIRIGSELEHVLPQELALIGDEITSRLFDKKLIEGELMYFDMEGFKGQTKKFEKEEIVEVLEDDKIGPIIICVDTSGSMSGSPETIAKAITLFISSRAMKQKRKCYLINFSTSIETLDLSDKMGLKELISFLGRSFLGGTDVAPAMRHALKKMKEEKYEKSDLLVISDFVMPSLPDDLEKSIKKAKKRKNKFYSLVIGDMFFEKRLKNIFDKEWVYNPNSSSVTELIKMANEIK